MEKFTKLGLSKELVGVLKQSGFTEPSEIQEKAIPPILAGKDIIGGSATGSGKTLVFASGIIENIKPNNEIQALVLTPTRELAEQVATAIRHFSKNKKLRVLAVYGGVNIETQIRKLAVTDILVGTPGRILDHMNRRTLRLDKIKFLVLDEVDRMFDMGFSYDVEKIIKECPTNRQTMMFSATISSDIDYLAKKYSKHPIEITVKSYVDPSKLTQFYYDIPDRQKFSLLVSLLKQEDADLVMVFCSTRRNVDFITDNLIRNGIKAKAIHGGMDQKKRIRTLDEFHKKGLGVLVCTDVAARGLDIKGVSHVYNYDVPNDDVDYIHRIGRTARAGQNGKAITILASRDYEKFGTMVQRGNLKLTLKKLPQLEKVNIQAQPRRDSRFSRPRSFGGPRDSKGPRRDGTGPRRSSTRPYSKTSPRDSTNSRGFSRPRRENRDKSRKDPRRESKRTGSYNRDSSKRNSRGPRNPNNSRSFNRENSPRRYSNNRQNSRPSRPRR